jgi:hypothetical protein
MIDGNRETAVTPLSNDIFCRTGDRIMKSQGHQLSSQDGPLGVRASVCRYSSAPWHMVPDIFNRDGGKHCPFAIESSMPRSRLNVLSQETLEKAGCRIISPSK